MTAGQTNSTQMTNGFLTTISFEKKLSATGSALSDSASAENRTPLT